MALTLRWWCLLLGLCLAGLAALLLPPDPGRPWRLFDAFWPEWSYAYRVPPSEPLRQQQQFLLRELSRAEQRLRRLDLRDSLAEWVPPGGPAVRLVLRGGVPAPIAARMGRVADSLRRVLERQGPLPGRLALVVTGDTVPEYGSDDYNYLLLPQAGKPGLCALVLQASSLRRIEGVRWAEAQLAPCAFYTAFGAPGREVEHWLFRRGFDVASAADWWVSPGPDRSAAVDVAWWHTGLLAMMFDREWRPLGPVGLIACRAGRAARCAPTLLAADISRAQPIRSDRGASYSRHGWWDYWLDRGERGLLRDLVREFGPEQFRAFWTSSAPPAEAFAAAFGVEFEVWAARWVPATMGRTVVGPSLRVGGVLAWLSVVGLALGGALLMARRRRLG